MLKRFILFISFPIFLLAANQPTNNITPIEFLKNILGTPSIIFFKQPLQCQENVNNYKCIIVNNDHVKLTNKSKKNMYLIYDAVSFKLDKKIGSKLNMKTFNFLNKPIKTFQDKKEKDKLIRELLFNISDISFKNIKIFKNNLEYLSFRKINIKNSMNNFIDNKKINDKNKISIDIDMNNISENFKKDVYYNNFQFLFIKKSDFLSLKKSNFHFDFVINKTKNKQDLMIKSDLLSTTNVKNLGILKVYFNFLLKNYNHMGKDVKLLQNTIQSNRNHQMNNLKKKVIIQSVLNNTQVDLILKKLLIHTTLNSNINFEYKISLDNFNNISIKDMISNYLKSYDIKF